MATCADVWEVVGGAAKGGIIVRTGKDTASAESDDRLSTGARVRILDSDKTSSRIQYELLSGTGPQTGWVTSKLQGKDLLVNISSSRNQPHDDQLVSKDVMQALRIDKAEISAEAALKEYCIRFGEQAKKDWNGFNRKAFPWQAVNQVCQAGSEDELRGRLEKEVGTLRAKDASDARPKRFQVKGWAEDSDGEDVRVCHHCNLPLGDHAYSRGKDCVHGECMAQLIVQDMRDEETSRLARDREAKNAQHAAYGIGWNPASIPRNDAAASKLAMRDVPQGMVCLVLDNGSRSIRIAAATEPSAALNLEYLSIALQVRRTEGHEPVFSLDPVHPDDKHSIQEKVFVPEWLAGTSVGEVLFQADYHLKELSMGEYEQPVVGMKSCFDHCEIESKHNWSAREWFLVRKAEVQHAVESNTLIPMVKMAVEAREQVIIGNSLEDKPVTHSDHPMVRYAEAFTRNFDLIAERKSVVFHLRELAKASVMAKYLLDSRMQLEETWFHLNGSVESCCSLEVPQLWNERTHSEVHLKDGSVTRSRNIATHGVYGGVQFGLEKFSLATSVARQASVGGSVQSMTAGMPQHRLAFGLSRRPGLAPVSSLTVAKGAQFAPPGSSLSAAAVSPARLGAALSAATISAPRLSTGLGLPSSSLAAMMREPKVQGVDLRLDQFDLSEARQVSLEAHAGSWCRDVKALDHCVAIGSAFFKSLDDSKSNFREDDYTLLKKVFHPKLCDRRAEGDLFMPPDASFSYVQKLRGLVKDEDSIRSARKELFLSKEFVADKPGSLFPHSWTESFGVARGKDEVRQPEGKAPLEVRPEYKGQGAALLDDMIQTASPVFDKTTEDGVRFRVYRLGILEIRTTQEANGTEVIGVVYSVLNQTSKASVTAVAAVQDEEKISTITEFVEKEFAISSDPSILRRRFYIVLETEKGQKVLTERLRNGSLAWIENPKDLEDRNSLAKVTRSEKVERAVTIGDVKEHKVKLAGGVPLSGKRYAQAMFLRVFGPKKSERPVPPYKEYMSALLSLQPKTKKEEPRSKVMPLAGSMMRPATRSTKFPK